MNRGKTVFSQLMDFLPWYQFTCAVKRYQGDYRVRTFTCRDQVLCMLFGQLSFRESLRDIIMCLRAQPSKLYHMGVSGGPSAVRRSQMPMKDAIGESMQIFAQTLIAEARQLYHADAFALDLTHLVYALDSTTIDLSLSAFPWATFRSTKAAVKMHTLLDLHGNIPTFINITEGAVHDVNVLDCLPLEPGAIYVMDRGYIDFSRLYQIHRQQAYFVIRAKRNLAFRRQYSHPVEKDTGLRWRSTHPTDRGGCGER